MTTYEQVPEKVANCEEFICGTLEGRRTNANSYEIWSGDNLLYRCGWSSHNKSGSGRHFFPSWGWYKRILEDNLTKIHLCIVNPHLVAVPENWEEAEKFSWF